MQILRNVLVRKVRKSVQLVSRDSIKGLVERKHDATVHIMVGYVCMITDHTQTKQNTPINYRLLLRTFFPVLDDVMPTDSFPLTFIDREV
jgi:hypothetical protein